MPSMPDATVVIVNYRTTALTLAAVGSSILAGADEVVVIDNGSADDIERHVTSAHPGVRICVNHVNRGFGAAANHGARQATGETIIFLNSDAQLTAGALPNLVREVRGRGGRSIVGPRLIGDDGTVQLSAGLLPGPFDLAVRGLGIHRIARALSRIPAVAGLVAGSRLATEYASASTATDTIDTNMVSGACMAIGREAFAELGGFDERFFMYFEDADLCRRAAQVGMPIRYASNALVTHVGGASSDGDYRFGPLHARSMRQYLGKWYGPPGSVLALALLWLRAVGSSFASASARRRAWAALWAALSDEDPRR